MQEPNHAAPPPLSRLRRRPPLRIFLTGLLAALPLMATLAIFGGVVGLLISWIGPESLVGSVLVAIGFGLSGSLVVSYLFGIVVVLAAIFGLGLVIESRWQHDKAVLVDTLFQRIPLVGKVYDLVRKMVDLFSQKERDGPKSMSAVWCHFGGVGGAAALALLGSPEPVVIGEQRYLAVLIPTAPVPVGGGLLYVPEAWVTPADVGIEAVTSIYVSMGLTSSQHLSRPAGVAEATATPATAAATAAAATSSGP
jgi:uncharacterized membrane protein